MNFRQYIATFVATSKQARREGLRGYTATGPGFVVGARGDQILKKIKLLAISHEKCVHFLIFG